MNFHTLLGTVSLPSTLNAHAGRARAAGQHGGLDEAVGTACTRSLLHLKLRQLLGESFRNQDKTSGIDGGVNDASATWELLHLVRGAALLRAASFMAFLGRHVPDAEAT